MIHPRPNASRLVLAVLLAVLPAAEAGAQGKGSTSAPASPGSDSLAVATTPAMPPLPSCDGKRVNAVEIRPGRPPFEGAATRWRHFARAIGLHHATTRPGVIDAFVALEEGDTCTELRRAESERVLREQPFLADASVRAIPDSLGGVTLLVETTDEIPVLVAARTRGVKLQQLSLGNENLGGNALLVQGSVERGYAYRTGFGVRVEEYATFGRPYVTSIDLQRHTLGYYGNLEMSHPFYTDLQRIGWHVGGLSAEDYVGIQRPANDPLALRVQQQRWDASTLVRVLGTKTVTLAGFGASAVRIAPDAQGIMVTDTGLAADTGTTLRNRYALFKATRVGVLAGVRRMSFTPVRGFDALTGTQDIASGFALGMYAAQGIKALGENDNFVSGIAYAGMARERAMLGTFGQMEARRDPVTHKWDSVIGSARAALYAGGGPGTLFIVEDRFSGGSASRLPMQLSLDDRQGGILGYHRSGIAGSIRNVVRTEVRVSRAAFVRNADVGVAAFGAVGSVWAGDAPYGVTATRSSLGVSLMAAYPTRSKRLYRADIGFPLTRSGSGGGIEVRFTSEDRTNEFLREPDDVSRARTGPVPSRQFAWPNR